MTPRFTNALNYVLVNEGPFSNDPRDPGGATKFGIILTEYAEFLKRDDLTPDDVKNMDLATAQAIYLKKFWNPIRGDGYASDAVATAIFDTAVNKGLGGCKLILSNACHQTFTGEAWEYLQDLQDAVAKFTPETFMAHFEPEVETYISNRIHRYPNMEWARRGWMNRAKKLFTLVAQ